ncbi:hypothetical protein [Nocardia australiensis]|uniref:hypothetical protein n=1 Tax=Nocardia australiensis TaxID=2887191 RepID=UPI001D139145|nr:hypothetical protein [Nocardia australiensis]
MKRLALVSAAVFFACFAFAVPLLVAADHKLDQRTDALLASHCARQVPVPAVATAFSWSATILLIVAAAAAVTFIVSAARFSSVAVKVPTIVVAGVAVIVSACYALLVGFSLLQPSSDEPISPRYHPCEAFF